MKRYNFIKAILGWIFRIVFRIKYVNRENQPPMGTPYIVCSNHAHFFDVVPIGLALKPQIHFMAKREVFKTPFLRGVAKLMGAYPVNRGGNDIGAIKKTIEILKNGGCAGEFRQFFLAQFLMSSIITDTLSDKFRYFAHNTSSYI